MKKTLSILIAAAMLTSSAAYAASNDGHGENGHKNPVHTEQRTDKTEAKAEKAETKPEKSEAKIEKSEVKAEKTETKLEKAEVKTEKAETKTEKSEAKIEKSEVKAEKTETKLEKSEVKTEKPEKSKVKPSDTADNSDNSEINSTENAANDEFRKELDNIKKIRREKKADANAVINDLRDIFHAAPKEDRKEILGEIAEVKKELKDESIGMFMRGKHVDFDKYDGVKPEIVKERTLIPLRAVSETLGAEVEWNDENKTVTVTYNDSTIIVTIDSQTAIVNGEEIEIDSPALIKNGRVLVPIRLIAESLGLTVEWDEDSHSVIVDETEPTEITEPVETPAPVETTEPTEIAAPTETIAE